MNETIEKSKFLSLFEIYTVISLCLRPEDLYKIVLVYRLKKRAPEKFNDVISLASSSLDDNASVQLVNKDKESNKETVEAMYLHNYPVFVPFSKSTSPFNFII